MTGFGRGEAALPNGKIAVEVRSLNSKQLDLSVKLPMAYRQFESEIRDTAGKQLGRGKADIFVTVESAAVETSARINKEIFSEYMRQLAEAANYAGTEFDTASAVAAVLRLPDVVSSESAGIGEVEAAALRAALADAMARIDAFRAQEGATLIADLLRRVDKIENMLLDIAPYESARAETVRNRIREHIAALDIEVDTNRLEQEMIFYIEKLDITEEKVRLKNHCRYFREVAAEEEGVGRKLGFIAQEMGREINTLGSKANDAEIQKTVVKMKDELEKIKEQVLNIL